MAREGYERRKLELEVAKQKKRGNITEEEMDKLLSLIKEGYEDTVRDVLDSEEMSFESLRRIPPLNMTEDEYFYLLSFLREMDPYDEKIEVHESLKEKVEEL